MKHLQTAFALAATAAIAAGCGGGGSDPEKPTVSTSSFAVRASADSIFTAGISGATFGRDNIVKPASVGGTPAFDYYNDWSGRITITKRAPGPTFAAANPGCASATAFIDMNVTSTRKRDGVVLNEGASFGVDSQYKAICAFMNDGRYWAWNPGGDGLPVSAIAKGSLTGVQFSGSVSRTIESTDLDSTLTGNVSLDPDTESSAYLTFSYYVTPLVATSAYRAFGNSTQFRLRISTTGALLGFTYHRNGYVPETSGGLVLTNLTVGVL